MRSSTWKDSIGGVARFGEIRSFEGKVRFGTRKAGNAGGMPRGQGVVGGLGFTM